MHANDYKELDYRAGDGVEVGLYWSRSTNAVVVAVSDERTGDAFELVVEPEFAFDAFNHPYAYAAHRGVEFAAPSTEPVYA